MSDEDVALFISITGIEERATVLHYLEAYGDLNSAVAAALDGHAPPRQEVSAADLRCDVAEQLPEWEISSAASSLVTHATSTSSATECTASACDAMACVPRTAFDAGRSS